MEFSTPEELDLKRSAVLTKLGGLCRHFQHIKTGKLYIVLNVSLCEKTKEVLVTYKSLTTEHVPLIWTRTAEEFLDGRFVMHMKEMPGG